MLETRPGYLDLAKSGVRSAFAAFGSMPTLFAVLFVTFTATAWARLALMRTNPKSFDFFGIVYSMFDILLSSGLMALFAVVIHRFVIRGEKREMNALAPLRDTILEFGFLPLILNVIQILMAGVVILLATLLGFGFISFLLGGSLTIGAIFVGLRLSLIFPAIAVEAPNRSLRAAFRDGSGLVLRILVGGLLVAAPFWLAQSAILAVPGVRGGVASIMVNVAVQMIVGAATIAIISRLFVWRKQQA